MKTKEELNALKEEVEIMSKKLHELTEEDLEKVVGGGNAITQNSNGTYTVCAGAKFKMGSQRLSVIGTYTNVTLDTRILCEYFFEQISPNGESSLDFGTTYYSLKQLLDWK